MKKMKKLFKILAFLAIGAFAFTACDKDPDLPYPGFDDMEFAGDFYIYSLSWEDDTINTVLPAAIAEEWENKLKIANVRGNATNVDVIMHFSNGSAWFGPYTVHTGITSFPAEVSMDASTLVGLIEPYVDITSIQAGHSYAFSLRITTQEGKTYDTREVIGGVLRNKLSTNIRNYPGANFIMNLSAVNVCPVDMEDLVGTWEVAEFSDRFSAADNFSVTVTLDTDGETLIINGLVAWLLPGSAKLTFDKSNPYAWVPSFDQTHLYGTTGHPYDIRILNNSDYDPSFKSCELQIVIGYEVGAYSVGGPLLGYFDWGIWTLTKAEPPVKSMSNETNQSKNQDIQIVGSKN
jgi:hypothetical protein